MIKIFAKSLLLCSLLTLVHANAIDDNSFENDFESLLNDVSDIATKKSLNIDYLPSVVTVIDAQTYRDAGIQNIAQALDMLPGVQMQLSPMGYTMTTVRGLKKPKCISL
jgi:outer membrane receptor for ferric coprogen and ferric-rhodotorulic acid